MLKDSVFLITGGGSGLGKATTETLLKSGAKVVVCDLKFPEKCDPIYNYDEKSLLFFKADVTSEQDIRQLFIEIKEKFGKLNGIINCAGVYLIEPVHDFKTDKPHSLETFNKMINVNVLGTFNVIRLGVPLLAESVRQLKEQAVIINTSSLLGYRGLEYTIAYAASKGAIIGMTRPLAKELKDFGIRVVDIAPGLFDTPLAASITSDKFRGMSFAAFPNRLGKPDEYARLVKSIIDIMYLNGVSLPIDGLETI